MVTEGGSKTTMYELKSFLRLMEYGLGSVVFIVVISPIHHICTIEPSLEMMTLPNLSPPLQNAELPPIHPC
jgi:hypothetical protein